MYNLLLDFFSKSVCERQSAYTIGAEGVYFRIWSLWFSVPLSGFWCFANVACIHFFSILNMQLKTSVLLRRDMVLWFDCSNISIGKCYPHSLFMGHEQYLSNDVRKTPLCGFMLLHVLFLRHLTIDYFQQEHGLS